MSIFVDEKSKRFYLAGEKWIPVVGHEIKVDDYRFCAIPLDSGINISEVTSGSKIYEIPMSVEVLVATNTKELAIAYLEDVGKRLKKMIENQSDFDVRVENNRDIAIQSLGEMPPIEYVDTDWVVADETEYLN